MAKKKSNEDHTPKNYLIHVNVDRDGNFTYMTDDGENASTLKPINGDTVQWDVRVKGRRQPFTIEFPGNGPFGVTNRVIRSFGSQPTTKRQVKVSKFFRGNLCMKYNVILTNGWSDDPDIVPSPAEGILPAVANEAILLSLDASDGHLVVTPQYASLSAGVVKWKWATDDLDEFTLKFDPPVPGWPTTTDSQGNPDRIELNLPVPATAGAKPYKITTPDYGESLPCTLTIT